MKQVYVIFDGPPSNESGRFIEVETPEGKSVGLDGFGWDLMKAQYADVDVYRLGPFAVIDEEAVAEVERSLMALALEVPAEVWEHHAGLVRKLTRAEA